MTTKDPFERLQDAYNNLDDVGFKKAIEALRRCFLDPRDTIIPDTGWKWAEPKANRSPRIEDRAAGDVLTVVHEVLKEFQDARRYSNVHTRQVARDIQNTIASRIASATPSTPKCTTCNDNGMIGGPSYYNPGEGGEPCPDCATPSAKPSTEPMSETDRIEFALRDAGFDYERAYAIAHAAPSAAVGEDKSAYWAAITDDGDIDHIYNADDGSGGEAAREEMNGWINDRLLNDKVLLHLVPLYTAPTKPGHMVEGETEKLLSVLLHVREQLGRANHEIGQFRFGGGAERLENGQKIVSDLYAELRYGKHADMLNATQGGKGEGE